MIGTNRVYYEAVKHYTYILYIISLILNKIKEKINGKISETIKDQGFHGRLLVSR